MLCPNCGYNNQANNRFCVRCGIDISAPPPPETPSFETGLPEPPFASPPPPPGTTGPPPEPSSPPPGTSGPPPAAPNPWGAPHPAPPPYAAPGQPPPPPPYAPGPGPYASPPPAGGPPNPFAPPGAYPPPPGAGPYAPYPPYPPSGYQTAPTNGLAIASLVLALIGWIPCGIGSLVAVVLGFVARSQIRAAQGRQGGDGLALAGIIIGFLAIGFWILLLVLGLATGSSSTS